VLVEPDLLDNGVVSNEVFPDLPRPSSISRSRSYVIINSDLKTDDSLAALAMQMFSDPEASFHYYHPKGQVSELIRTSGDVRWDETEFFFYQHKSERDFVRIPPPPNETYRWDWEKEYVETRPEFVRHILRLSDRRRWQLETVERIHIEEFYREERRRKTFASDIFLSFADSNRHEAELVESKLTAAGQKVFLSVKNLNPGDDFAERIRNALRETRELWLLVTPQSIKSEWVMTEWGAAWVLGKSIVPILLRCRAEELADRLQRLQCIDLHRVDEYIAGRFTKST
jgi:TIR domain